MVLSGTTLVLALLYTVRLAAADGIVIEAPWARASLGPVPNSAAYMVIRSDRPDRLVGAASPAAGRVELHTTTSHADVTQMRPVRALEIGPDRPATLQPGGLHLMLMGLEQTLVEGETVSLELTFERAGTVEVDAEIRGLDAGSGHGGHGGAHDRGGAEEHDGGHGDPDG